MSKKYFYLKSLAIIVLTIICYVLTIIEFKKYITNLDDLNKIKFFILFLFIFSAIVVVIMLFLSYKKETKIIKTKDYYNLFSIIAQHLNQSLITFSNDYKVLWTNDTFTKLFGYSLEELKQNNPKKLITGELTEKSLFSKIEQTIFEDLKPYEQDVILYKKDGNYFWSKIQFTPIVKNDKLDRIVALITDISETKKREKEIQNSVAKFRQISEAIDSVFYLYNLKNKKYELMGAQSVKVLGVPPGYFFKANNYVKEYVYSEDQIILKNALNDLLLNKVNYEIEYRIVSDNKIKWVYEKAFPITDKNNEIIKISGICKDITTEVVRKKEIELKEVALEKSELNLRLISNSIDDVIFLFNLEELKYEYISSKTIDIWGLDNSFFYKGKDHLKDFAHKKDIEAINNYIQTSTKQNCEIEYRIIVDGKIKWIHEKAFPISEGGVVKKISSICSDITEKKLIQEKLIQNQKNTKLLAEIGFEISDVHDIEEITTIVYKKINKILKADFFGIGIIDKVKNRIDFPHFIENGKSFKSSYNLNDNILATICINSQQEIILNNLDDIKNYSNKQLDKTIGDISHSVIYLPLWCKGEIVGVITIQCKENNVYQSNEIDIFKNIAIYVAKSIEQIYFYQSLEDKIKERTTEIKIQQEKLRQAYLNSELLSKIGTELSSTLKLEEVFDKLHFHISQLLNADIFSIRVLNEDKKTIDYKFGVENGVKSEQISISLKDKDNYTVWCIENNKVILIGDNKNEYQKYVNEIKVPIGNMPESLIFTPIVHNSKVIGAITVQSFKKNAYSKQHVSIMQTLAFYTGIAMSNAELYKTLELKVEKRTQELSEVNKEITQSINYTKNLQNATLTKKEEINRLLNNSFVFYQPKNIVSGDFYIIKELYNKNTNEKLITILIADCTGHGVPGASLAILCNNIIRQSFVQSEVTKPAHALEYTRQNLIKLFKNSDRIIQDGMDASLLAYYPESKRLEFTGAYNNCYIIRDGNLLVYKGDKSHVGYSEVQVPFTTQTIQLKKGDNIYLSTDGFPDQFGGPNHKKFNRKRFLNLLLDINHLSANEKKQKIKNTINEWKGTTDQTDDICVLGFTVN